MDINISNYLRLNPVDMALVCISTFILCLIAKHYFWDIIKDYFKKRTEAIQADIDAGANAKLVGEEYKSQYEMQLSNIKSEAHTILETAKRSATNEKKEILAAAREEAQGMKTKAIQDIEREKIHAQKEMQQTIRDVAFEAAGKIIKKELNETDQQRYVDEFIQQVGEDSWQA